MTITKEKLTALLQGAADAHHVYEKNLGKPDPDWPAWYAEHILAQLRSEETQHEDGFQFWHDKLRDEELLTPEETAADIGPLDSLQKSKSFNLQTLEPRGFLGERISPNSSRPIIRPFFRWLWQKIVEGFAAIPPTAYPRI